MQRVAYVEKVGRARTTVPNEVRPARVAAVTDIDRGGLERYVPTEIQAALQN
jgi:hypothetical protein